MAMEDKTAEFIESTEGNNENNSCISQALQVERDSSTEPPNLLYNETKEINAVEIINNENMTFEATVHDHFDSSSIKELKGNLDFEDEDPDTIKDEDYLDNIVHNVIDNIIKNNLEPDVVQESLQNNLQEIQDQVESVIEELEKTNEIENPPIELDLIKSKGTEPDGAEDKLNFLDTALQQNLITDLVKTNENSQEKNHESSSTNLNETQENGYTSHEETSAEGIAEQFEIANKSNNNVECQNVNSESVHKTDNDIKNYLQSDNMDPVIEDEDMTEKVVPSDNDVGDNLKNVNTTAITEMQDREFGNSLHNDTAVDSDIFKGVDDNEPIAPIITSSETNSSKEEEVHDSCGLQNRDNITITSILEATLTIGKLNQIENTTSDPIINTFNSTTEDRFPNEQCNFENDLENSDDLLSTNLSDDCDDEEIDLFTPLVTVDELPEECEPEDVNKKLEDNENIPAVKNSSDMVIGKDMEKHEKNIRAAPPPTPDLIVREFCLQQDSLCNLVSASIESTLNMDSVEKGEQNESYVQHLLLAESGITSFTTIEDVFKQAKTFTSTEYLLLYTKIEHTCIDIDASLLIRSVDLKRKSKITANKILNSKIEKIARSCLSKTSIEKVENMMQKIHGLGIAERLFLHNSFPKVYKTIKESLQKTTISCRPVVSQTVMWLKTHYEEYPSILISKPDVFKRYILYCAKNELKPCGIPDFGKMIKRTFPNIYHRRQVVRGKTQYFYCGLRPIYKLPIPKLPKLSDKTQVAEVPYSCSGCCNIYVYMHNLKYRMKSVKDYLNGPGSDGKKNNRISKEGDKNCSKKIGGIPKPVVVHDPLELLSLSMNDNSNSQSSLNNDSQSNNANSSSDGYRVHTATSIREYKNTKVHINSRSGGKVIKVKYKQYKHPSVKKLMDRYENVIISHKLFKLNVNPKVHINNNDLHNWCASKIKNFIEQLSNLAIAKVSDSSKLKIKHSCCNSSTKVNSYCGEALRDLKKELDNIHIKKENDNHTVTYFLPTAQLPDLLEAEEHTTCSIIKRLDKGTPKHNLSFSKHSKSKCGSIFHAIKYKHESVNNLFKRFDNITLPEEALKSNIDPLVVLDSREVTDWYEIQLNKLKRKLLNNDTNQNNEVVPDCRKKVPPFRESRAKLMNFCESDSWDSEDLLIINDNQTGTCSVQFYKSGNEKKISESNSDLQISQKRLLENPEPAGPLQKKQFHLSDIISDSENRTPETCNVIPTSTNENLESEQLQFTCFFCLKEFKNQKEFSNHRDIHLRCRTCKRRMPNENVMRLHLIKHCFMNNAMCTPNLILPRVDDINTEVNKYPLDTSSLLSKTIPNILNIKRKVARRKSVCSSRYPTSVLNFNNIHNLEQLVLPVVPNDIVNDNRKAKSTQNSTKSQKSANYLRFTKPTPTDVSHYQIAANSFKNMMEGQHVQQSTSQLKSTISNNFNRIFLLSNNTSPSQAESSNIVYGLYLNNRTDGSTPICLNTYNRMGSDCALNINPSCSIPESTNFMQIVETPNTPLPPYDPSVITETTIGPFEQHQDHSYYQQPVFSINNDVSSLSSGLLNGVSQENMHSNSLFEMPFLNNINTETQSCSEQIVSNTHKIENTSPLPPPPMPGPFRIRVKDIRELS